MTTVGVALAGAAAELARAGVDDAAREAGWLLAHVLGTSAGALRLRQAEVLGPEPAERFAGLVARRAAREPIQYLLGTTEFLGLTFRVSPAVLIPRLDTEVLVQESARLLRGRGSVRVADVGTGSGAIAVGLAHLLPEATVVAVDISPDALGVARENAAALGQGGRVEFRQGDLLAPLAGEALDAIISNPPYIPAEEWVALMPEVKEYEPKGALTPGDDGLHYYRRLAAEGLTLLNPGGFLAVEVGIGQAAGVEALFSAAGLTVEVHRDTGGIQRVVIGHVL